MSEPRTRRSPPPVTSVTLLLSGRCNLSCAYCYQDARACASSLGWQDARAALDRLLASRARVRTVEFNGGEPLLEWELLRRCVEYAGVRAQKRRPMRFLLTTNGMLLTPERMRWLEANRFSLRLSFDGVADAQRLRGPTTFRRLDGLLKEMRASYPALFNRLRVHAAVLPETVPSFADSAAFFLKRGVPEVYFYPIPHGGWPLERITALREQAGRIVEMSAAHFERERAVPLLFLRADAPEGAACPDDDKRCGASKAEGFCVDPDGNAWTCPLLVGTFTAVPAPAREAAEVVALGDVRDAAFAFLLAGLPARAATVRLLRGEGRRFSGYGECSACEHRRDCRICPATLARRDPEGGGERVPDFVCAFTTTTLEARRAFAERTGGRAREVQLQRLREAAAALANALQRAGEEEARKPGGLEERKRKPRGTPPLS